MLKKFTTKPIKNTQKENKKSNHKKDSKIELNKIYNETSPVIVKPNFQSNKWLLTILVAMLFSLITMMGYNYFISKLEVTPEQQKKVIIEHQEKVTVTVDERLSQLEKNISPTIVNFYGQPDTKTGLFYQDNYSYGTGFILTSDGWLVTTQKVLDKIGEKKYVILTSDYALYQTEKVLTDPISPLVFVKIKANNLPVAKLGDINSLTSGQRAYGFIASYPQTKLASLHLADLKQTVLKDVVASSEKISHFISAREGYNNSLVGSPIVNLAGEIIGVINDKQTATPVDIIKTALKNLNQDKLVRTEMGVHYIELAKYPKLNLTNNKMIKQGALLSGYKNLTAVVKGSPADKAGLKVGDIILSIEDETLNGSKTLGQIIQEYTPGETIKLLVLRKGKEKNIEVTLGKLE